MSGLSTNGEAVVLNALLAARFVSLHTADPVNTGDAEVVGGNYVRKAAAFTNSGGNPTIASNSAIIQFPTATAEWGVVGFFGIWSAVSGGSFLGGWPLVDPKTVKVDDTVRWDVGKLQIASDEVIS